MDRPKRLTTIIVITTIAVAVAVAAMLAAQRAAEGAPAGASFEGRADVLAVAVLPSGFKVVGPYARVAYKALGLPEGSLLNVSALAGRARIVWHVDRLILVMPNGTRVAIEARTEVVQIAVNGSWMTIPPAFIRPGYNITVEGEATLSALMRYAEELLKQISRSPPPLNIPPSAKIALNFTVVPVVVVNLSRPIQRIKGLPLVVPPQLWSQLNATKHNSTSDPTWALSAFVPINSSNTICGYLFPLNSSDLVLPISDYAGVPLTIFQEFENNGQVVGFLAPQVVAQLWPPALVENVWLDLNLMNRGGLLLTSPVDWLATGVTLCISQVGSNGNYEIALTAAVNGNNYTLAIIFEFSTPSGYYLLYISPGPNVNGSQNSTSVKATPVFGSVSYQASRPVLYPSMAFETNDTSSSFFGDNAGFALEFQMGDSLEDVGEWALYYSISTDSIACGNIWGTSAVGSAWPPPNAVWGASGMTVLYYYGSVYDGAVGSTSQLQSRGYANVVGISCNYVDTDLSSLNVVVLRGIT